ncbi:unnamed protein product, partial [Litomosoides sigmodontis]
MLLGLYALIILGTIDHFGVGAEIAQEELIDEVFSNVMNNAREMFVELKQRNEAAQLQNRNVMKQMRVPFKIWDLRTLSEPNFHKFAHAALISVAAAKELKINGIESANSLSAVLKHIHKYCPLHEIECAINKYRTVDGTCNNLFHPHWGANGSPMQRVIAPFYANGIDELRVSIVDNSELPNVRHLSNLFFAKKYPPTLKVNMLNALWAHFVYTDLVQIESLQLFNENEQISLPCCAPEIRQHPECKSIAVPKSDQSYGTFLNCIPYIRSAPAPRPNCELGSREQANQITSFLDGSVIYGSTVERARELRAFKNGHLLTSSDPLNQNLPPTINSLCSFLKNAAECDLNSLIGGSDHVNFLPFAFLLHAIWIRQHNRIATNLMTVNPHWSDEELYQESRRIVIAQLQHITYNEFLPILVGKENWLKYELKPKSDGYGKRYDGKVDATVINTYAAIAGQ